MSCVVDRKNKLKKTAYLMHDIVKLPRAHPFLSEKLMSKSNSFEITGKNNFCRQRSPDKSAFNLSHYLTLRE